MDDVGAHRQAQVLGQLGTAAAMRGGDAFDPGAHLRVVDLELRLGTQEDGWIGEGAGRGL